MSFYSYKNRGNERCPGRITFDGCKKIIEKVCIQVDKVYDACLQQETLNDVRIVVKDVCGDLREFTPPFTFIGCRSTSVKGKLVGTQITRLPDRPNFARVQTKVEIPVEVVFEDAHGKKGTGNSFICVPKDVILYVPDESVIPFQLESTVNAMCVSGRIVPGDVLRFDVDVCVTIILKIVAKVELLVPSFGFCDIPPCEEFAENVCEQFFSLPLFPPQLEDVNPRMRTMQDEQE
ncbi:hypothetical protein JOD02_001184 [Caldicoprobacter guelmensis]|uniref:hypothetical protein n=1 Tax=Caldicoprobacter guelmensis TaxID=1170224 RepID=UPI00195C506E|nr:hypothetical protein [Caldicoprobacter guelmensis]MBM7582327.1 hypothetical protein [Caldicoprobacter guelmensis]